MSLIHVYFMFWFLYKTLATGQASEYFGCCAGALAFWVVGMKFHKIANYFTKFPKVLVLSIFYLLLGRCCTFVKLWALATMGETCWVVARPATLAEQVEREDVADKYKDHSD